MGELPTRHRSMARVTRPGRHSVGYGGRMIYEPIATINPRTVGVRLQEARKARGLTQQEVADQLSLARTTVVAMEKGERAVQPTELIRLANLYCRSIHDLLRRLEP